MGLTRFRFAVTFVVLAPVLVAAQGAAAVDWYLLDISMAETDQSLSLGDGEHEASLRGGWSCSISATSKNLPLYEARQVRCSSKEHIVEFSVQCEPSRPTDHTQLRFRSPNGEEFDFIELSCRYRRG